MFLYVNLCWIVIDNDFFKNPWDLTRFLAGEDDNFSRGNSPLNMGSKQHSIKIVK